MNSATTTVITENLTLDALLKQPGSTMRPLLYKVSTVMELLDISRTTVYRLIAKGDLKLIKIGISGSRITSASVHGILGTEQ